MDGAKWRSKYTLKEIIPNNKAVFYRIFESLKYRDFKLYFWGQCISLIGSWIQTIAMSWLVYRLSGSIVLLGTVVFLIQIPMLVVTPFTSVLIDRYNKRNLLLLTQALAMVQALALALLVFTDTVQIWHILALSLFNGCYSALDMPARQAFYTTLVPHQNLSNAVALNSSIMNGSRLIGPAIGGFFIHLFGEAGCFLINAISFLFVLGALYKIKTVHQTHDPSSKMNIWGDLKAGYLYVKQSLPIKALLFTLSGFSFCVYPATVFLAAYVKDTLHSDSTVLGYLMSGAGIGAFISTMYLAARKSILGIGKVLVLSSLLGALSLIPLFFIQHVWAALIVIAFLGFGITCSVAAINTLLQALSDQNMRGRIMGYYSMAFIGLSAVGALFWSWLADFISLALTMAIAGSISILFSLWFEKHRPVVRQHARPIYIKKGIIKEIAEGLEAAEG